MSLSLFKYLTLLSLQKSLTCFALCVWLLLPHTTFAGRCTGSASCKACTTCNSCNYCSIKGGTCGVCNPIEEKDNPSNQNPLTYYLLGAGSLGGGLLIYRKIKTKK
jgi:hypothetical protein